MTKIPSKVQSRLIAGIKKFQPILTEAKARGINDRSRNVNESDTVIIIVEMLSELFGYDKFTELTSEKEIRGTYCDLATIIDQKVQTLIEAKAINQDLKEAYIKQAVDYACNQGVDWVVLTNGIVWQIYRVTFTKPIDHDLILEIDFLAIDPHEEGDLEKLFLLTKESWPKSALSDYCDQKQALSKQCIGAVILSDPVLHAIRHELRQISPDVKIEMEQIRTVLEQEVFQQGILEGEKSDAARKLIKRAQSIGRKNKADRGSSDSDKTPDVQGQPTPQVLASTPQATQVREANVSAASSPTVRATARPSTPIV